MTRQQMAAYVQERFDEEYTPEEIAGEAFVLKRFGLIPPPTDYMKTLMTLLQQEVAGVYDPFSATLMLATWVPDQLLAATMTHEITHALQDQHYGLKSLFKKRAERNDDARVAQSAIIEGDATLVMFLSQLNAHVSPNDPKEQKILGEATDQLLDTLEGVNLASSSDLNPLSNLKAQDYPSYMRHALYFPYQQGLSAAITLFRRSKFKEINALLATPPPSTEWILNESALKNKIDQPAMISSQRLTANLQKTDPKEAWTLVYSNVLGQFGCHCLLDPTTCNEQQACRFWHGDRTHLYRTKNHYLLISRWLWDSSDQAQRFRQAIGKRLRQVDMARSMKTKVMKQGRKVAIIGLSKTYPKPIRYESFVLADLP